MRPIILRSVRAAALTAALAVTMASGARSECTKPILLDASIAFLTGPNADYMVARDFNGDGITDLAVTNADLSPGSFNASLAVLIGTGGRTYAAPVLYAVGRGARGVVTGDFDGDGITDLAVANLFSNTISVLRGQGAGGVGNGTFAPAVSYPTGAGPFELVAADINRDGILDLAAALNGANAVCVLPGLGSGGTGNGTFGLYTTFPVGNLGLGLAQGDFNHDGIPDLVATEYTSGTVGVLLGTGAPTIGPSSFLPVMHYGAGAEPYHIEVADLNADGSLDLAVANTASGGVQVLLGHPNGTFTPQASLASGNSSGVAAGDLNGDGIPDLVTGVVTGSNTGIAKVFLGQGSGGVGTATYGPATSYHTNGDVYQVIVGDLDGDGAQDALVSEGNGNYVELLPGICADAPPDPRVPVLTGVRDVPNDNGGKVFLTWTASLLDVAGGAVNSYRVWRRIPPQLAASARTTSQDVIAMPMGDLIVYWEALATLPAQRLSGYGYTAPTTQDSMPHSNPYTAFFVSALTSNIDEFYSSAVDSGYSVDNLSPHRPGPMMGEAVASGFWLHWGASPDADLAGYRLYRGPSADFLPSPATRIAAPLDTVWFDAQGHGEWFYKVSAVDIHDNESDVSMLAPNGATGVGSDAPVFALHGARPNPSVDGRLSISFVLASGPGARIEVLDVTGRQVLARDLTAWGAGSHVLTLGDERPLPSGIYFVRLIQGLESRQARAIVTR